MLNLKKVIRKQIFYFLDDHEPDFLNDDDVIIQSPRPEVRTFLSCFL